MVIWSIFTLMCLFVVLLGVAYWKFTAMSQQAQQAWKTLDQALRYRADFIPPLTLASSSIESLDRNLLSRLQTLQQEVKKARPLSQRIHCETEITESFKTIFTAVAQHPEIAQNDSFNQLQQSIIQAEGKVRRAQKKYNQTARKYSIHIIECLHPLSDGRVCASRSTQSLKKMYRPSGALNT